MTVALPALSLSSSFTQIGAIAAFAALVGIAVMSLLFFAQARELKRLREWAEEAPARAAELEHRLTMATALRIQRATAQPARPVVEGRATRSPVAAVLATGVASQVAEGVPMEELAPKTLATVLLPAAPTVIAARAAAKPPEPTAQAAAVVEEPGEEPELEPSEQVLATVGAAEAAVGAGEAAVGVPREAVGAAKAAVGAPEPPVGVPARAAPKRRAPIPPSPAAVAPRRSIPPQRSGVGGRAQPPRRGGRRPRSGPPPGPPFLREEPARGRGRLLLLAGGVLLVVVLAVIVFSSNGASKSKSPPLRTPPISPSTAPHASTQSESEVAANPAEVHVVVLNDTETSGLAHRVAANLQQSGYTQAGPQGGKPTTSHASTVVQYTAGHRVDARHVAQTLGVSGVAPLESSAAGLVGSATVVVIAGPDLASSTSSSTSSSPAESSAPAEGSAEATGGGSG